MFNPSLIDGPITVYTYGEPDVGGVRQVTGTVPGYHLNVAPQIMTPELEPFRIEPTNPRQIFCGAETAFLKFADETEAKTILNAYWIES